MTAAGAGFESRASLADGLRRLGVEAGDILMAHSSLSSIGYVLGGAPSVVLALLDVLGPDGALVMPAFSPDVSDPAGWHDRPFEDALLERARAEVPVFDPAVTPTRMGAIAEAFRTFPNVRRSLHPQVSVTACGPHADSIVAPHLPEWGQGAGSPFERLYALDARLLLLGVGFNRATLLHFAESRVPHGRRKLRRIPFEEGGARVWRELPDVGDDLGVHFPALGAAFLKTGRARRGQLGNASCTLASARALVDFASDYLARALEAPTPPSPPA